jgi:hypothetical protein
MKRINLYIIGLLVVISSCTSVRYDTERYIKNNIEIHKTGEYSSIKIISLYNQTSMKDGSRLEMTGYKYNNQKGLVISAYSYYKDRKKFKEDNTVLSNTAFILLDTVQCRTILTNYNQLEAKLKTENPGSEEEIFMDFTVSEDLFFSMQKAKGGGVSNDVYLWIKGEKYTIASDALLNNMEDFLKW